tara:strand:- start:735 stop:899 length:165 start_codon:yes stop_codon:yes gene_type:complete
MYYDYNFSMIQHHQWSLSDLENLIPWERDIYVDKLIQHIKDENDRIKAEQRKHG